jgi:hypothetical protein
VFCFGPWLPRTPYCTTYSFLFPFRESDIGATGLNVNGDRLAKSFLHCRESITCHVRNVVLSKVLFAVVTWALRVVTLLREGAEYSEDTYNIAVIL